MAQGVASARKQYKNPWNSNDWYPKKHGFKDTPTTGIMQEGVYDRYGGDAGSFLAPEHTPFEQRSLPLIKNDLSIYNKYRVIKPIPGVLMGETAPWFGFPGGGYQYYLPHSIEYYINKGYIIKL